MNTGTAISAPTTSNSAYIIRTETIEKELGELRKKEEEQKKAMKDLKKLSEKYLSAIKSLLKLKSGKELTTEMIETFISKIYVYPGKGIEVEFNFTSESINEVTV